MKSGLLLTKLHRLAVNLRSLCQTPRSSGGTIARQGVSQRVIGVLQLPEHRWIVRLGAPLSFDDGDGLAVEVKRSGMIAPGMKESAQDTQGPGQRQTIGDRRFLRGRQCPPDSQGLLIAPQSACAVTETPVRSITLNQPDLFVRNRQFSLQAKITARFLCQRVEVLECPVNEQLPGRRRSGQVLNGIVNIKHQ